MFKAAGRFRRERSNDGCPQVMLPTHQQCLSCDPTGQANWHAHLHCPFSQSFSKQIDLEENIKDEHGQR